MILLVDDDAAVRDGLSHELRAAGHATTTVADGAEALRLFRAGAPDLVITDLAMPRADTRRHAERTRSISAAEILPLRVAQSQDDAADGFALISAIRAMSPVPIIVLSVRSSDADKVRALDLGADDFVTKPFSLAELLARIRAQLRRSNVLPPPVLEFAGLTIDLQRRRVLQEGREVRLTPTELALLELLAANAGKPMFIEQIIARVWPSTPSTTADTVRVHMSSLRKKIEPNPSDPRYIVTEPWVGYRFIAEPIFTKS